MVILVLVHYGGYLSKLWIYSNYEMASHTVKYPIKFLICRRAGKLVTCSVYRTIAVFLEID